MTVRRSVECTVTVCTCLYPVFQCVTGWLHLCALQLDAAVAATCCNQVDWLIAWLEDQLTASAPVTAPGASSPFTAVLRTKLPSVLYHDTADIRVHVLCKLCCIVMPHAECGSINVHSVGQSQLISATESTTTI